jgi:hypothetical protein
MHPYEPEGSSDRNVTLVRPEFPAQACDHRGNFFRLPPNRPVGQGDPESSQCLDVAGGKGKGRPEHVGGLDRRKTYPLGIPLVKEMIPLRHESVDVGLRILTDPDAAPDPVLRLRQDRRIEILSQPEFEGKPEPVAQKKVAEPFTEKDPRIEQPGPVMR